MFVNYDNVGFWDVEVLVCWWYGCLIVIMGIVGLSVVVFLNIIKCKVVVYSWKCSKFYGSCIGNYISLVVIIVLLLLVERWCYWGIDYWCLVFIVCVVWGE